jgi:pimeloyl-ACP methyl ester carboxylesterase
MALGVAGAVGFTLAAISAAAEWLPRREDLRPDDVALPEARYLDVAGKSVAFTEQGCGETALILLHGFSCDMRSWHAVQPLLSSTYRTIAIDLYGFGASARPATLTPFDWMDEVIGVMDALGIASAVFVGHSMGGRVAMMCAVHHPDRVQALVLIDSDGLQLLKATPFLWAAARRPLLRLALRQLRESPERLRRFIARGYSDNFPVSEELTQRYERPLRVAGTENCWLHLARSYPGMEMRVLLPAITSPALLIWGADDRITKIGYALKMAKALSKVELVVLPHTGHLSHEERPVAVDAHVRRFLTSLFPL